jgi:hypothetical protein
MFSRDFTRHYTYPAGRSQEEYQVLGGYTGSMYTGSLSIPRFNHCWVEAELMPDAFIGGTGLLDQMTENLTAARTSTYKVVRSVADVECLGFED